MSLTSTSNILGDYTIARWVSSGDHEFQFNNLLYYSSLSFGCSFGTWIFVGLRTAIFVFGAQYACFMIHQEMIKYVFEAPINLYFDVTPIGRILNKFTKDLMTVQGMFGIQLGNFA